MRFEKGLDVEGVPAAARRFFRLLKEVCPDAEPVGAPRDVRVAAADAPVIDLAGDFVARRLGIDVPPDLVAESLERLGFGVERSGGRAARDRPDLAARAGRLPPGRPRRGGRTHPRLRQDPAGAPAGGAPSRCRSSPERAARGLVRDALTNGAGLSEVHLYPFTTAAECERFGIEPGTLQLANADQPGLDLMSTSLVPGLLRIAAENLKYRPDVGLYAVQPVFLAGEAGELPRQDERVAIAFARRDGAPPAFVVKDAVERLLEAFRISNVRLQQQDGAPPWLHPGQSARVGRGKQEFGWFGTLHPRVERALDVSAPVAVADLDLVALRAAMGKVAKVAPISRYPAVTYDVAVVADRRVPAGDVESTLRRVDAKLVRDVRLFDVYEGKNLPAGTRSMAFAIVFGAMDRTLDGADVERLRGAVADAIAKRGWTLRT